MLLHLLNLEEWRGRGWWFLGSLYEDRPILGYRHILVECGRFIKSRYLDSDVEFALGMAAIDAHGWRNIGIIPAECGTNVALVCQQVIRRVEANPA